MADLTVLSLGWGVQSFTLAAMSALGDLPRLDYAIHADTTHERTATYEFARRWTPWLEQHGIPVLTVPPDDGGRVLRWHGVALPAYTVTERGNGMIGRQCTNHWKVYPTFAAIRQLLGPRWRQKRVDMWVGISWDEAHRMKPSGRRYINRCWPLAARYITRAQCVAWLEWHGIEVPQKSSCVFCPFQSNREWQQLPPDDWGKAVAVDHAIRDALLPGRLFLHPARIPLEAVDLRSEAERNGQLSLWQNECEGHCGV